MEGNICLVCSQPIEHSDYAVTCDLCKNLNHLHCGTSISEQLYEVCMKEHLHLPYRCIICCPIPNDGSITSHTDNASNSSVSEKQDTSRYDIFEEKYKPENHSTEVEMGTIPKESEASPSLKSPPGERVFQILNHGTHRGKVCNTQSRR